MCNRHSVPSQPAMPSCTGGPCTWRSSNYYYVTEQIQRDEAGSVGKDYTWVTGFIFRSHGWLKTTFGNKHGRACWSPGCPRPRTLPDGCGVLPGKALQSSGGAWSPQASLLAVSSLSGLLHLLLKCYRFLGTSRRENKILRSTGVRG